MRRFCGIKFFPHLQGISCPLHLIYSHLLFVSLLFLFFYGPSMFLFFGKRLLDPTSKEETCSEKEVRY
ncbi:MAG: hypothetical protein D6679_09350 [Candidatus Hydrogenedentota bacterium]|nr:MAG: hypothetical protein D6679_09350 [Candidatus Hydrogenedentota bacterium]